MTELFGQIERTRSSIDHRSRMLLGFMV